MKRAKKLIRLISVTVILLMSLMIAVYADSEVNEDVKNARKGVLQVQLFYEDSSGESYNVGGGSAFLINDDTIVTCYHVVHVEEYEDYAAAVESIPNFDTKNIKIKVVVRNDVRLDARILQESRISDFSILRLEQPISGRNVLKLAPNKATETQQVYALGFPDSVAMFQNQNTYTYEDVTISDGRVTKTNESDGVKYVQHSATLSDGYSGGPLVNYSGDVIAINRGTLTENNYSVNICEITAVLDDLEIEYTKGDGLKTEKDDKDDQKDDETEPVTEPTIRETEKITTPAVEKPTVSNASSFDDEDEDEKEKSGFDKTTLMIIIGVAAVVIILIIILIVSLSGKKKAPVVQTPPMRPNMPPMPGPGPQGGFGGYTSGAPTAPKPAGYNSFGNDGGDATTVLNEGSGETTVLGAGAASTAQTVIRVKSGERISVDRPEFLIGKERRRVNYCISDNNSVSRVHVKLLNRGGQLFLMDMNATNGTYVNGTKLNPNQEVRISSGDTFKLADEEFRVL